MLVGWTHAREDAVQRVPPARAGTRRQAPVHRRRRLVVRVRRAGAVRLPDGGGTAMTTTIPTPILRPIRFVTDVAAWQAFYADLGFISTGVEADGWVVLAADSGRLALHHAEPESPLVGKAKLAWEVPDLEAYRTAVAGTGTDIRRATFDRGDVLVADLPQGRVVIDRA